ncbi:MULTISPECIES: PP0621 family protein [Giesbergeria]|uniref:PP0621 family protein n=1 Tax=Giesbergeria sinuosa TaxID=80883 RepID=A0ABV9Q7M1_9BURK
MKYLVLLIVLVLAYGWWRSGRRAQMRQGTAPRQPPQTAQQTPASALDMVPCAHCGLHVPRNEALAQGTRYYCCLEHQQHHARP